MTKKKLEIIKIIAIILLIALVITAGIIYIVNNQNTQSEEIIEDNIDTDKVESLINTYIDGLDKSDYSTIISVMDTKGAVAYDQIYNDWSVFEYTYENNIYDDEIEYYESYLEEDLDYKKEAYSELTSYHVTGEIEEISSMNDTVEGLIKAEVSLTTAYQMTIDDETYDEGETNTVYFYIYNYKIIATGYLSSIEDDDVDYSEIYDENGDLIIDENAL